MLTSIEKDLVNEAMSKNPLQLLDNTDKSMSLVTNWNASSGKTVAPRSRGRQDVCATRPSAKDYDALQKMLAFLRKPIKLIRWSRAFISG